MAGEIPPFPWFSYEPTFVERNKLLNLEQKAEELEKRVADLEEAVVALNPMLDTALMVMESVKRAAKRLRLQYGTSRSRT